MPRRHPFGSALAAVAPLLAVFGVGSRATLPSIPTWYAGLNKPWFTPPNWAFGPAWTTIYVLIAYAFWRVLTLDRPLADKRAAIVVFLVQVFFNGLWSVVFFGMRSPGGGLAVVAAMWLSIAANIYVFSKLDGIAAWLLVPYLAWVSYAAALNLGVFLLN